MEKKTETKNIQFQKAWNISLSNDLLPTFVLLLCR